MPTIATVRTTPHPTEPVQRLLDRLQKVQAHANGWEALCPAHDDHRRSLSIGVGRDGRALLKCQANCSTDAVLTALNLSKSDLFVDSRSNSNGNSKPVVKVYDYRDSAGNLRFQVVRYDPKDFKQRRPSSAGDYIWNMKGVEKVLYRLPGVLEAVKRSDVVYVVEGEKAADELVRLGCCATCTAGGAGKWDRTPSAREVLRGAMVVVLPDNDEPGRQHAVQVVASLQGVAASVVPLSLPGLPVKGDVFDWIEAGGTREALTGLIEANKAKPAPGSPVFRSLDRVEAEAVRWLSPGRIPLGKITIVEGDPGLGKTMVMGDLAARVTRGRGFPGDPKIDPADVVILTGEDGLSDTLRPRLEAAGAVLQRVKVMEGVNRDEGHQGDGLSLPRDIGALQQLVGITGAKAVIIDVLNAFLDGAVDSYKDHEIRRALYPFKLMAEETGAAVVLLRHLSKRGGNRAIAAGGGSVGIGGAARSVLLVGQDPADRENKRVLASVKCNLGPPPPSLAFQIEQHESGAPIVRWLGQSTETADSLVADRAACDGSADGEGKQDEAMSLLEGWLLSGEKDKKDVLRLAQNSGISSRTLERAANSLGVKREQKGFGTQKRSYWSLPSNPATSPTVKKAGTIGDGGTNEDSEALTWQASPPADQSRQLGNPKEVGSIAGPDLFI